MADVVRQSRWGYRTRFEFGERALGYSTSDPSGERDFTAPYEALQMDSTSLLRIKPQRAMRYLYPVFMAGLLLPTLIAPGERYARAVSFIVCGAIALFGLVREMTEWLDVTLTLIPCAAPPRVPVRVIGGGAHDAIVARLQAERRRRIRMLWAVLNLQADLEAERQRFDWLLANGFIDADEHADAAARIAAAETGTPPTRVVH